MAVLDVQFMKLPGWSCAAPCLSVTSHIAEYPMLNLRECGGRYPYDDILGSSIMLGHMRLVDLLKRTAFFLSRKTDLSFYAHLAQKPLSSIMAWHHETRQDPDLEQLRSLLRCSPHPSIRGVKD
eukprot:1158566-Pelagomonas_calceolata.AAC.7